MKLLAAFVPYVSVLVGMYVFHSAWLAVLLYHLGVVAFVVCRKPENIWQRMWAGTKSPLLIPGLIGYAMVAPVVYFMWPWISVSDSILPEWMARYGLTGAAWLLMIPYFSLVHPILEEIHWRGISPEKVNGICWQDLVFAGYHVLVLFQVIDWLWLFLVFGILAGSSVFWRWSAGKFGGYGLPILTHAVADAGVIIGVYFLLK